ncbi:ethanolamine ammonia-lyase subunit EutC [Tepidimonas taiwanensis]|uniref:ethanolamine ammonia-lyase subunit EutC n=2 Tax=Tepidimonas taiwanensis TaxID=307486 RepID=UPI001CC9B938|nr:ethanolamine ammonia-lyase subunit EutC [Tepidimonas taiwanensis]MCX7693777.1 ethanolamine ammonia-lyase subunit EutC [Tepidimonas taiwanensis]UBQ05013.1 ethanolamine ammonia-lyase subunit EutC [Tepidimonas taiwanensis]
MKPVEFMAESEGVVVPTGPTSALAPSVWERLREHTPARIGLGRCGVGLPTAELLRFGLAHAQARDAVHVPLDITTLVHALRDDGWPEPLVLHSRAGTRRDYLLRPDWGRRLDEPSVRLLQKVSGKGPCPDLVLVVADGLSALGIQRHAVALLRAIRDVQEPDWVLAPPVVVEQGRVAVGDEIGELLEAQMVAVIIGERPGLSSPDSLGIYLTYQPRVGCRDAQRNCISNVRPEGQDLVIAAKRLMWLAREARRQGCTGVALKDMSGLPLTRADILDAPASSEALTSQRR